MPKIKQLPDGSAYLIDTSALRKFREEKKLTQLAMAQAMGLHHALSWYRVESGRQGLSAEQLAQCANVLGVPMESLIRMATDPKEIKKLHQAKSRERKPPPKRFIVPLDAIDPCKPIKPY